MLFQKLAQIAVVTVAVFQGRDLLGIDLTTLAIFSGAFGLAIGFGLQRLSAISFRGSSSSWTARYETLITEEVENWSYSSRDVRVHIGFHVSNDCDLRVVQRLAVEAARALEDDVRIPGTDHSDGHD